MEVRRRGPTMFAKRRVRISVSGTRPGKLTGELPFHNEPTFMNTKETPMAETELMTTESTVYVTYIASSPERVWDALATAFPA